MKQNEENILEQNTEDEFEEDIEDLEEEVKKEGEEKPKSQTMKQKQSTKQEPVATETYEIFGQPARLGIVNTSNGDIIEGFDSSKDEAIVKLGREILNKLDKISTASGV